jgi:hypothetical protein
MTREVHGRTLTDRGALPAIIATARRVVGQTGEKKRQQATHCGPALAVRVEVFQQTFSRRLLVRGTRDDLVHRCGIIDDEVRVALDLFGGEWRLHEKSAEA